MSTAVGRLVRAELRLMTRDPLVLTFVFAFPIVTMLIIGGAFGTTPDRAFDFTNPSHWYVASYLTVVIAAEGYPAAPASGDQIDGLEDAQRQPGAYVLHAGTSANGAGGLRSSGGRVLNVVGTGRDLAGARAAAYRAASLIRMRGGWYRTDIAAQPCIAAESGP